MGGAEAEYSEDFEDWKGMDIALEMWRGELA